MPKLRTTPRACQPLCLEPLEDRRVFSLVDAFDLIHSRPVLSTPDAYHAFALANLDGDADLDLVVAAGPRIYTLLNNGQAQFTLANVFRVSGYADNLALADFDGDGITDLAAQGPPGTGSSELLRVFQGAGNGTWTKTTTIKAAADSNWMFASNFDTDARRELLIAANGTVRVYQMNACIPNAPRTIFTASDSLHETIADVAVADMNFDGISDAVIAANGDAVIKMRPGDSPVGPVLRGPAFGEARIHVAHISNNDVAIQTVFSRVFSAGGLFSVAVSNMGGSSTRPDILASGINITQNKHVGDLASIELIDQAANGAFNSGVTVFSQSSQPNAEVLDIDIIQARDIRIESSVRRDFTFTLRRDLFGTIDEQTLVMANTGSSFDQLGIKYTNTPDIYPAYFVSDIDNSDNKPDLLYMVLDPSIGGKNKLRFAANQIGFM
jgi:hypothetical protein